MIPLMVVVITSSGSPVQIPLAQDARMLEGRLVCLNGAGERLVSFDPIDVRAYTIEAPGCEPVWVMGGLDLVMSERESGQGSRPAWKLPEHLRFNYR